MPVGPLGQHPVNPIEDGAAESSQPQSTVTQPEQHPTARSEAAIQSQLTALSFGDEHPPAAKSAAAIAVQLVQHARAAKTSGNKPSIAAPLGDLVNAVTSQLGVGSLPNEQRQKLVAQLSDDPVVKSLIG